MCDIPPDFDKPWEMADVVLRAKNSDGKPLHVSKSMLAIFSSYFRALFFGGFKEKDHNEVDVDCDYSALLEILRVFHHSDWDPSRAIHYEADNIIEMYTAADRFDFPLIRKLCKRHMILNPKLKMAEAALTLALPDLLKQILNTSTVDTVEAILSTEDSRSIFSKKDLFSFYKSAVLKQLPLEFAALPKSLSLNLEEIVEEVKNPRVDLTKPWRMGNVAIITVCSLGRVIYANKLVLELVCTNLDAKLSQTQELQLEDIPEGAIMPQYQMNLNMEYTTAKQIFSIIHHCDMNFFCGPKLHPALLFDMYREAEEVFDIPMIRKLCLDQLLLQPTPASLDVALTLGLGNEIKESFFASLSEDDLLSWLYNDKKTLSYMSCGKEMILTTGADEAILSMKNIHYIVERLRKKFSK